MAIQAQPAHTAAAADVPRAWRAASAAALILAVLAVFASTFDAGLVNWDDESAIGRNQGWRGLGAVELEWMFRTPAMGHYQPLSWLSLGVDHALYGLSSGGEFPEAGRYHRTSVLVHALAAWAFLALARRVLARALPRARARAREAGAWFAAAFFALHPLRAESVAWLTERRDVLSGLFFLLALRAHWAAVECDERSCAGAVPARSGVLLAAALGTAALAAGAFWGAVDWSVASALTLRSPAALSAALAALVACALCAARASHAAPGARARFLLALLAALASLLCKAWGIVLPALLWIVDWGALRRAPDLRTGLRRAAEKAPYWALTAIFARLALWAQASTPGTLADLGTHGPLQRVLQGAYGLLWYPLKTFAPHGLVPYVPVPAGLSLGDPRFAAALATVLAAAALAIWARRRAPLTVAAWASFAVIVAPVLGVAQSGPQLVADRYSYLACLPLCLLAAAGLVRLSLRQAGVATAVGALALAATATLGARQARVWHDSERLWGHALAVDARDGFAAQKLAQAQLARAASTRDAGARAALLESATALLEGAPREFDPVWLTTLAQALQVRARGQPGAQRELRARAVELCQRAIELQGGAVEADVRLNYANALIEAGEAARAVGELERYTAARPFEALGWVNLGVALAASGRASAALAPLRRGVELDPGYAKGWQFLAQACEQVADREGARRAWTRLLELWPQSDQARARLAALGGP